jgi:sugar O-acyltransferase (sialic acid O-acetyltransferase NeuD family)
MSPLSRLVILGAGGYARELVDLATDIGGWELVGFAEADDARRGEVLNGVPVVGSLGNVERAGDLFAVAGSGDIAPRSRQIAEIEAAGIMAATLVHPTAVVSRHSALGEGTVVCAGASVTSNTTVGRHVLLNNSVTVAHDITIGDRCVLSPGVRISGWVRIEDGCYLGVGAVVLPRVRIGAGAIVGAGAVVTRDVEPGSVVVGVPARPMRHGDAG